MFLGYGLAAAFMATCCDISVSGITTIFNNISPKAWFWLDLFNFQSGIRILLCAIVTKWMIRWIPFSPK